MSTSTPLWKTIDRRAFLGGLGATCGLALLNLSTPLRAFAVTSAEKQAEADAAKARLSELQDQLDIASDNYIDAVHAQEDAQHKMDEAQQRIDEVTAQIGEVQDKLGTRARTMYRSGSLSFLDMLLGATTFQAFVSNWDLLNSMNADDAAMVQQSKDLKAEAEAQKAVYTEQHEIAVQKTAEAEAVRRNAEQLVSEQQTIYDNLSAEAAELLRQEEEAKRRAEEEAAATARAAAAALAAAQQSAPSRSSASYDDEDAPSAGVQSVSGSVVVDRALSKLGCPYVWATAGPSTFDCSGLVSYALTGEYVHYWSTSSIVNWPRVSNPQPGDICIRVGHTGVYMGDGQMVHADGRRVSIGPVESQMWYVRY